jgi:hypothetical protein
MKVNYTSHKYPTKEQIDERISDIMVEFDFQKVHEAMTALDWVWFGIGIPSINELRAAAFNSLNEAASHLSDKQWGSGSGGLSVSYSRHHDKANGNWFRLDLSFYVDTTIYDDGITF